MLKMAKCPLLFSLLSFIALGMLCALNAHSAPSLSSQQLQRAAQRLAMSELQPEEVAILPSPPSAVREERDADAVFPTLDTSPKELHFIKVCSFNCTFSYNIHNLAASKLLMHHCHSFLQSSKCRLNHRRQDSKKPKICGYRQVDLPQGASGVLLWRPAECRPYHCRCTPTKEVRRMRRTIADNKTTLDYHRFRVFECV